jgi:hypothetical protein
MANLFPPVAPVSCAIAKVPHNAHMSKSKEKRRMIVVDYYVLGITI